MRPLRLHVAYVNPEREPDSDAPERRQPLLLSANDLMTHLHGVGSTRSGKSKWLEWFCRQLYRNYIGFTVLDPQGALSEELIGWLAVMVPETPVIYFEPNRSDQLIPFNPFRAVPGAVPADPNYLTRVAVRAKSQADATLRAWNMDGSEHAPRLNRWLYCIYYLFARGLLTFAQAGELLSLSGAELRERIVEHLADEPGLASEWRDLNQLTRRPSDFYAQIESTRNKLFSFINQPQIRRLFAPQQGSLDFDAVFRGHAIVICNLKPGVALHNDDTKLLGALIINDLWSAVERYTSPPSERPYFLLVDEVQKFLTPDLKEILDRGAGKGLRLGAFHQHLTQLQASDQWTFASLITNAKIKLAFGGLSYDDARLMVNELFTGQIELDEIKSVLEQTKFWPVYDRDTVRSRATARSHGEGHSAGSGFGASSGEMVRYDPALSAFQGEAIMTSSGSAQSHFEGLSSFEGESSSEGEADVPIYRPVPFKEPSSVDFYSLEEQKERLAGALMNQYRRHLFIRVPGRATSPALTPYVEPARLTPALEEHETLENFIIPYAFPIAELDALVRQRPRAEELPDPSADPTTFRE